jgi:thymidylate synthase (FAD)
VNVKLISITKPDIQGLQNAEDLVAYCARVSNPSNQMNSESAPKLLGFLIKHKHWSPFEMVDMTIEIKTSRAIAAQILRHRSFSFQEFSQRYSVATHFKDIEFRLQGDKNRQVGENL